MDPRPTSEEIKKRALEMVEETMAFPGDAQERLLGIKRGALATLIAKPDQALMEKHYPGWTVDDLKTLLGFLPAGKKDAWHL